jgi:hypothetical protein
VEVAGQELVLLARRHSPGHPNQLGGACEALYDGRSWPCAVGSRHVHVHWYASLPSLGLTPAEMEAVRRAHPLPNLSARAVVAGLLVASVLTALLAAAGAAVWQVSGGHGWVAAGATAAVTAPVAFLGVLFLAARATSGYWD